MFIVQIKVISYYFELSVDHTCVAIKDCPTPETLEDEKLSKAFVRCLHIFYKEFLTLDFSFHFVAL